MDQVKSQLLNLFLSIKLHTTIDWAHIHLSTCCKFELGYCTERSNQCQLTKVICNMIFFFFKASYNKVSNGIFCYFNDIFGTKKWYEEILWKIRNILKTHIPLHPNPPPRSNVGKSKLLHTALSRKANDLRYFAQNIFLVIGSLILDFANLKSKVPETLFLQMWQCTKFDVNSKVFMRRKYFHMFTLAWPLTFYLEIWWGGLKILRKFQSILTFDLKINRGHLLHQLHNHFVITM